MVRPLFAKSNGYVLLLSVLVVAAVALAIGVGGILLAVGSAKTSLVAQQSYQAKSLANLCAEEALQKLRESVYYTGNESSSFTTGSCQIQTISGTGNVNRTIQTVGTVGTVQRKVKVIVATVQPTINVSSWQEVDNF